MLPLWGAPLATGDSQEAVREILCSVDAVTKGKYLWLFYSKSLRLSSCSWKDILGHQFEFSAAQHDRWKNFHQYIHAYNAAFSFVSLGYKKDDHVQGNGPPVFKICGTLAHYHGSLLPDVSSFLTFRLFLTP